MRSGSPDHVSDGDLDLGERGNAERVPGSARYKVRVEFLPRDDQRSDAVIDIWSPVPAAPEMPVPVAEPASSLQARPSQRWT